MTPKRTFLLLLIGLLVLGGGWFVTRQEAAKHGTATAGALLFPGIAPALQFAARIEITSKGKTITIARDGDRWGVAERGGYAVQPVKLREMLTGLTELRLIEQRTSDPAQFVRLGLDDASKPDSTANLLRVLDGSGKAIVEVITGHRRVRTAGGGANVPESIYVRRPGENATWLAEGRLAVDADPQLWLDRDVLNIQLPSVQVVRVQRGDDALTLTRAADGSVLKLTAPADVPDIDPFKVEETGRGLESLTFQEVKEAKDTPGTKLGTSTYATTDGLTIAATLFKDGEAIWVQFAVSGTSAVKEEADRLAKRLHGWVYQVGSWKEKAMTPTVADLKNPPPQPDAPAGPPTGMPPGMPSGMPR